MTTRAMNLTPLQRLLPEWEFRVSENGWLHFAPNGNWMTNHNTSDPWDSDHLCAEIEQALLKREDVYAVNVRSDKSGQVYIELDAEESSWRWQSITEDRPTRLAALLAAIERLPGLGGTECDQ